MGRPSPTRTLVDLPGAAGVKTDSGLSRFGGLPTRKDKATGFFHTAKIGDRWWLADPEGCLFVQRGVTSVSMLGTPAAQNAWKQKFADETTRAEQTTNLLRTHGFNGLGAWTGTERLSAVKSPLVSSC